MARKPLLLLVFVFGTVHCPAAGKKGQPMNEGAVTGVVVLEDGSTAANFKVCTEVHIHQTLTEGTLTCCPATTDHDGKFSIEHLKPGTYEVLATNDAQGYSVQNQSPGKNVTITEKDLRPRVTIRLHNRGAVVVGSVTDRKTGEIIHHAHLEYNGVDCEAGGDVLEDDGQYYPLAIPTNCDVVVIARAKGYRGWVYTDAASPLRPVLRLAPGERKVLEIKLEAIPESSAER